MMFDAQKRKAVPSSVAPSAKMAKTEMDQNGRPGWTCDKCGNFNFEGREYCNRRACQAPGPWTCQSCGNQNYAQRMVCNRRGCSLPRPASPNGGGGPPASAGGIQDVLKILGGNPAIAAQLQAAGVDLHSLAAPQGGGGGAPAAAVGSKYPEGSWRCINCQNVNFPGRTTCNAKNCGMDRSQCDGGLVSGGGGGGGGGGARQPSTYPEGSWQCMACNNVNFPTRTTCNAKNCGMDRSQCDGGPPPAGAVNMSSPQVPMLGGGSAPAGGGGHPEGSWVCMSCKNVNFPGRTTCNARNCGMERSQCDGGSPSPGHSKVSGPPPEGSWVCSGCGNVNFPTRMECNRKACGMPRASADAGPPSPGGGLFGGAGGAPPMAPQSGQADQGAPEGSWTCPYCGNVNYPTRTACNRKACGQPRYQYA